MIVLTVGAGLADENWNFRFVSGENFSLFLEFWGAGVLESFFGKGDDGRGDGIWNSIGGINVEECTLDFIRFPNQLTFKTFFYPNNFASLVPTVRPPVPASSTSSTPSFQLLL